MTPEEINELTKHFIIAKLESDLKIELTKFEWVETNYSGPCKKYSDKTLRIVREIERQLKELKA